MVSVRPYEPSSDALLVYALWQGVPTNLPGAWPFFAACGWQEADLQRRQR